MTTLDVEIAMMKLLNVRRNIIVPNVSWGAGFAHELDLLLITRAGYGTEIEIKTSASDLRADFKKPHGHYSNRVKYLYYAVPASLEELAIDLIPDHAGLYVVTTYNNQHNAHMARSAKPKKPFRKFTDEEIRKILRLGTMRILGLKQTISTHIRNKAKT